MSDLLKRLEHLSPEKRELVLQKLKQQQQSLQNNGKQTPSLTPVSREQTLPLSFAQQRMWFLDRLEGENSSYNVPFFWQINGFLNIAALEQAIGEIVQRHEVLRTSFSVVDGSPIQVIHADLKLKIEVLDWQKLAAADQLYRSRQLAKDELQQPFDLSNGPLLRVKLLQFTDRSHLLLLTIHHIACDGWSMDIFRRELFALYSAFCAQLPSPLPALSLQYADFAHWQRQWLQGDVLQTQLNYWQQQLAAAPPLLELPTDRSRPSTQTYRGRSEFLQLDRDLTQKLKRLSQESGTTLFMTLLTAFKLLLSRYSGQEDIVVGSAIANRNRREIEPLIGFFVNTLALRTNLHGNPTFLELLERVKQVTLDAYDRQDLPFEKLVDELGLERSLSHHPLFQVVFSLQNKTPEILASNGLTLTPFKWENTTTLFDLSLIFRETPQGLSGEWEYASDLFAATTIQRMAGHFAVLLQGIVDRPQQSIDTLPLTTAAELLQLQLWNQTDTDYPHDRTLVDLFEQQVTKNSDRLAVVFESQSLTYQQLNQQANQLAHYLIQNHQIQPDTLISICVERSVEMIVGMLGILKAGAAYVPIDPNYPQDRIQWILQDSGTAVLLTQSFLIEKLSLNQLATPYQIICFDRTDFAEELTTNPSPQSTPDDLAYVIYTSGSTGRPKGVAIEHRALTNLALASAHTFQVQTHSRFLQLASFSFDISIGEIAQTLAAGACLYLAKSETLLPSQVLVDFLTEHRISHIIIPPSVLSVLPPASLPDLQTIIVGGEACPAELVAQWAQRRRFFNGYGPTESTIGTTISLCEPDGKKPSIGQPLPNIRIYILDAHNHILPPGIPGELCIAGVGLARGYLHRPDLTAAKFIEIELFGKTERIYRTGDLAKWNYDGNIEYLGRIDEQVKLRGFRIELGEIESLLLQHQLVKEAVVILSELDANPRLLAYITALENSVNLGDRLQEYLKIRLPNYMIPSQIIFIDKLPLTPNGKLDRQALPVPNSASSSDFELPVTPTESLLATLWQALLKVKSVGRRDNFFELGGHSLLATQLITRIRDSFGVELAVRKVFEQSSLAKLATAIDRSTTNVVLPPIFPQPEHEPKTMSFAQSRLWFLAQLEGTGTSATYNMPIAFELNGNLNIAALRASFDYLIDRHAILRTYFPALDGAAQVVVQNPAEIEVLELADLRSLDPKTQAKTVQKLADAHAQAPFDLNTGPLFKTKLLQLGAAKHVLLMNMHHIISDGWSMGVFKREWQQAYSAYAAGNPPNLSPLPIQYSDYAAWQRSWLQGEILANQENYWKQQLGGLPKLLELPTDYARPAIQSYQGANEESNLSTELTHRLNALSQQQGVSLFMTLLSALSILLSRYSRQEDLCIGAPIANRTHSHTEGLMGFFVNTLVLRSTIEPAQKFTELLQQTRQTCLEAYSHQDIPFEYLVEKLQPERSLSHNPLFQVMMTLQNLEGAGAKIDLPGLDLQWFDRSYPFAKFDLRLDLVEYDDVLHCTWEYATDLFAPATIHRMAKHWEILLEAIVDNPQRSICELPLITAAEIEQLQTWNQTEIDYPRSKTLVDLFEEQVAKTPANIAVLFEDRSLSYQQLNHRANQLAHYLLTLKTQNHLPDRPLMAICIDRSLEMVIGLLGILKAGGAYVPIDPNYPRDRIQVMLEDSGASILLTTNSIHQRLPLAHLANPCQADARPSGSPTRKAARSREVSSRIMRDKTAHQAVVCLELETFVNQPTDNPSPQSCSDDLAYVIYTSGSTGKPKGAMNAHIGIVNRILWMQNTYQLTDRDCILQKTPFSFDVSVWEFFWPLIAGAKLAIAKPEGHQDPVYLCEIIARYHITTIHFVPSMLQAFLHNLQVQKCGTLQRVICSGEALSIELQQTFFQSFRPLGTELHNLYGPTETAVDVSYWQCQPSSPDPFVPIGKPIANTQLYVLDKHQQPLPIGIPGELHIGGIQLGRGYLNRPDLTAQKFIQLDLFGQSAQFYKTGDLAKWLPDGNLQYLGRIDSQVKLRGFRIELGEIEATLVKHPQIQEAVVIVREELDVDRSLLAYIVPAPTADDDLPGEQVELWQQVFNDAYHQPQHPEDDPTLNFASWHDSYTGKLYPTATMQAWRDRTVDQILELAPKRVREIGCGTGMLLFKIAPHCQHYLGTDISAAGLDYIEQYLQYQALQDKVTLKQSAADRFDGIESNNYDLVILNSVIQYFPSVDYLLSVIEGAIDTVTDRGAIAVGDIRNLHLLAAFHTAVEFYRAPDELSIQDLHQQIQTSIRTEGELLVDPDFFIALKHKFPRISHVQIQLKRGDAHTEMSRFRYDVILHLDRTDIPVAEPEWLDWQAEQLNLEKIEQILTTQQPDLLGIKDILNARLTSEMLLLEEVGRSADTGTVADLKIAVAQAKLGIEPEVFRILVRDLPYTPFIQFSTTDFFHYDVVFQRNISEDLTVPRFSHRDKLQLKPWQSYVNQPLQSDRDRLDPALLAQLRDFLGKTLPAYMIPSHFIGLEKIPLTPNGKIDRQALPAPNAAVPSTDLELPVTSTEKLLAQIWTKLLKHAAIARTDNFFNLGGHSLLATQLVARIRDTFKVELPLRQVFEFPTLDRLATYLDTCIWVNSTTADLQPLNSQEEEFEL